MATALRSIDPKEALAELSARQARQHLIPFTELTKHDYRASWHHHLTALHLEAVERGDIKRLMIFEPPRHGKSELSSIRFPSWYLGRHPENNFIHASYAADLASDFGRKVRNLTADPLFSEMFPDSLMSEDSSAVARWNTKKGGAYFAAGVGGPIGGRGAHILNIDDPIKDRRQADSAVYRETCWQWYTDVALPRLSGLVPGPAGAVVLTMTRWHKDDLAGRILKRASEIGEKWVILNLPAIAEKTEQFRNFGDALWPDAYPMSALLGIKAASGSRAWAALYQQNPLDIEGAIFNRVWFEIVDSLPPDVMKVRAWDKASTEPDGSNDPDWTAGSGMAKSKDGIYYLYDMKRFQMQPLGVEKMVRQTAALDARDVKIFMEQEPGSSGKDTIDRYGRVVLDGFRFEGIPTTGSKVLRAEGLSAKAEAGYVKLVRGAWNEEFLSEAEQFPSGAHDDQIDAASLAYDQLSKLEWSKPVSGYVAASAYGGGQGRRESQF